MHTESDIGDLRRERRGEDWEDLSKTRRGSRLSRTDMLRRGSYFGVFLSSNELPRDNANHLYTKLSQPDRKSTDQVDLLTGF